MKLWELIKQIREKHALSLNNFATKIGITATYVSFIERPYTDKNKHLPSEEVLRKIAKQFTHSEPDRKALEEKLLLERAKLVVAPEIVKDYLLDINKGKLIISDQEGKGTMPMAFINRLKKDFSNSPNLYKKSNISKGTVDAVLKGEQIIPRRTVMELATDLRQPVTEYLILAGYMPYEFLDVLTHKGMISMFRSFSKLSNKEIDDVVDAINKIIKVYTSKNTEEK